MITKKEHHFHRWQNGKFRHQKTIVYICYWVQVKIQIILNFYLILDVLFLNCLQIIPDVIGWLADHSQEVTLWKLSTTILVTDLLDQIFLSLNTN